MKRRIDEFEWDEGNQYKSLLRHNVTNEEAEEAFFDEYASIYKVREDRRIILGRSIAGRYLAQIFEFKGPYKVRIISSRDMSASEKRQYRRNVL